jgi:thymidylate synthase
MYVRAATVDDLLRHVLSKLLRVSSRITTLHGDAAELTGVLLHLTNPRARLSRTEARGRLFSALGELWWYLARTDDLRFISYYVPTRYEKESDDGLTVYGAYGPRLFATRGKDQVANVIALLKERPSSRRAVIQLFDAHDIARHHKNIPCTCTLQFLLRNGRLELFTNMRSNDALVGLPHDVFAFTMVQEILARTLSVETGAYKHAVGSMHLYSADRARARQFLKEGWQPTVSMSPMPKSDPWSSIKTVLTAEREIRLGRAVNPRALRLAPYWQDQVRLLQIYRYFRDKRAGDIARLKEQMSVSVYDPYIEEKRQIAAERRGRERGSN